MIRVWLIDSSNGHPVEEGIREMRELPLIGDRVSLPTGEGGFRCYQVVGRRWFPDSIQLVDVPDAYLIVRYPW